MTRALSPQAEQTPATQPAEPMLSTTPENETPESTPCTEAEQTPDTTAEPAPSAASPIDAPQDSPTSPRPPPSQRPSHQKLRHPMTQRRQTAPGTSTGGGPRRTSTADLLLPSYPQDPLSLPSYPQRPQSPPKSPPSSPPAPTQLSPSLTRSRSTTATSLRAGRWSAPVSAWPTSVA